MMILILIQLFILLTLLNVCLGWLIFTKVKEYREQKKLDNMVKVDSNFLLNNILGD